MSKIFDTHAHLSSQKIASFPSLPSNSNFQYLNVTTQPTEWLEALQFCEQHNNVLNSLGIHPWFVDETSERHLIQLESLISSKEAIIAIGEIGLDYAKLYQKNKTSQLKLFQAQVALAEKYKLPVSIHCYKAFDDLYSILNQTKVQGVLHGFNQSYQLAMQFIKLGFKIGVGSLILHSQTKLNKTVKLLPIESLVLETDYPHVNLAQSLLILEEIAKIKKLPISIVEETLYHNATQIFKRRVIS